METAGVPVPKSKPGKKKKAKSTTQRDPVMPEGETMETIAHQHAKLLAECKTKRPDVVHVRQLMDGTFFKRRTDILNENLRVWMILRDYPPFARSKGNELKSELARITEKPTIARDMKEKFEGDKSRLLSSIKKIPNKFVQQQIVLMDESDSADTSELENRCILGCLPTALGEKRTSRVFPGDFFWKIIDIETGEGTMEEAVEKSTTPRLVSSGDVCHIHSLCLAAEGMVVCQFGPTNAILNAVVTLIASYYAFNMSYPTGFSKNIYIFFDRLLLGKSSTEPLPIGVENFLSTLD